jgi:pseudooxynicotine oxidase
VGNAARGRGPGASRRSFLLALGGAAGLVALPGARAGAARSGPPAAGDPDVIVIGGGFAGVTAARELQHAGLHTLLLEARHRLGGRTFTARLGERHFDLGGMWVHWTQPHVWAEISRYGLPLEETPGAVPERVLWWSGGAVREAGARELMPLLGEALCSREPAPEGPLRLLQGLALMNGLMHEFHAGAAAALPRPFDPYASDGWRAADTLSVKDRLDAMGLSARRRALLEGVLGASCHGPLAECSFVEMLRWWALPGRDLERYNDAVARFKLRDGTVSLLEAMLEDGQPELRLGVPVAAVEEGEGEVLVTTGGGERLRARAVIAALPLNALGAIRFSPPLAPPLLAAAQQRHAGAGVKVYARVRGETPRVAAFAPESEPFSMILTGETGAEGGVLIAFGTSPDKIDVHSAAAVQAEVRRFLPGLEVLETVAYDWHLDPWSLGTWCILRPGQMTQLAAVQRAPEGRVHLAGGDFALGWRGFIDGAIESGSAVSHRVIAQLAGRSAPAAHPAPVAPAPATLAPGPGEAALRTCAVCHPTDPSDAHGVGPNLHGVSEREVAEAPGYAFSEALRARGGRWSAAELDAFLADPAGYAPGTAMAFPGVPDPAERAALVELLGKLR